LENKKVNIDIMNHLDKFTVEELQGYYSDFFKDYYGYRPRFATNEQWNNREWLIEHINIIHDDMDRMKETQQGRDELRESGWVIDEPFIQLED
jgi:hypothetical protein